MIDGIDILLNSLLQSLYKNVGHSPLICAYSKTGLLLVPYFGPIEKFLCMKKIVRRTVRWERMKITAFLSGLPTDYLFHMPKTSFVFFIHRHFRIESVTDPLKFQ